MRHEGPCVNYEGQNPEDYDEHDSCSRHLAVGSSRAIRDALAVIEQACRHSEEQLAGNDDRKALATLVAGMERIVDVLEPYAKGMPLPYPHTILVLTNGNTIRTTANTPEQIAGMINADVQKIYQCTDLTDGLIHNVMVSAILDFYQVTS